MSDPTPPSLHHESAEKIAETYGGLLPADYGAGVLIPGVTVEVSIDREGDPLVMILTRGSGDGTAALVVKAVGMDEDALCAVLNVVATTIETRDISPASSEWEAGR